jgi:hypothetical protein
MEKQSPNSFKIERSLKDIRKQFENGKIPKSKRRIKQMTIFDITHQHEDKGEKK